MRTQDAVNEFIQSRIAGDRSPLTIQWYCPKLTRFAQVYAKLPKDPKLIEAFLVDLTCSTIQRQNYFNALGAFYRFLRKRHHSTNPMDLVTPFPHPQRLMATLESKEERRLLNSASSLRDRSILTLLIDSGIRSSELTGLRQEDIKAESVRVSGKTGEREVPISEETRRLLLSVTAEDSKDGYVFHGHKGVLTRHGIYRIVSTHMRRAGIQGPKLGPHRVRHAFGKGYLVNGGDVRSLQQIMGHTNITTTQKYAALNLDDVITKHHKFTPLRATHAAAQENFFDTSQAVEEAEAILMKEAN